VSQCRCLSKEPERKEDDPKGASKCQTGPESKELARKRGEEEEESMTSFNVAGRIMHTRFIQ